MEREGFEVKYAPIDEFYVHIDLMVCMLAREARRGLPRHDRPRDRRRGCKSKRIEIVPVSFRDTMGLGCNVVALGNDRVLSVASSKDLNAKLRALGFTVYDPDMSQFLLAGGGVHCMCQQLRRDPV